MSIHLLLTRSCCMVLVAYFAVVKPAMCQEHLWSRTIAGGPLFEPPGHRRDPSFRFALAVIHQTESQFLGSCSYYNYNLETQPPRSIAIRGTRARNGSFWPLARLQVAKAEKGPWITASEPKQPAKVNILVIKPEAINQTLVVNLEPFKAFITTYAFGRVILDTGDTATFDLKDLSPPGSE